MKTIEHIKLLLEQGHKRGELIALGFPRQIVTRVYRNMKKERVDLGEKTHSVKATEKARVRKPANLPISRSAEQEKFESLAQEMESIQEFLPELRAVIASMKQTGIENQGCCHYMKDGICTLMSMMGEDYTLPGTGEIIRTEGKKQKW